MKIHELEVINFRDFEHQTFHFPEQFTVLIGDNGTGKTAILDALAIGAGCLFSGFDEVSKLHRLIRDDEVRRVSYAMGEIPTVEPQYPVSISCSGLVGGYEITWKQILEKVDEDNRHSLNSFEILNVSKQLQEKVRKGDSVVLPMVACYGTGRLWLQKKKQSVEPMKPSSRMLGYVDCLDPESNHQALQRWFQRMEGAALQRRESFGVLDAVKNAIANCIYYCESVNYDFLEAEISTTFKDGRILPFRMLSDGIRSMLGMVADIAYRAAVLNPQLGSEAAQKTPGIVLIDEIDLHLHPKWQRRVIDDLKAAFPAIQFVATTHSPFIVQSLREGELINLDPQPPAEYHDKSIEDIAENVMGVELPQKSERYLEMMKAAEEYYRVLQEAKDANSERIEELKDRLDELTIPYSDDPAYQAFLKMEREAAGIGSTEK